MVTTRSQTRKKKDENQCPNNRRRHSLSTPHNKSSTFRSPLKSSSSSIAKNNAKGGAASVQKMKQQQQWPSVKSLRENYEPPRDTVSLKFTDRGREWRSSYGSSTTKSLRKHYEPRRSSTDNILLVKEDGDEVDGVRWRRSSHGSGRRSSSSNSGAYRLQDDSKSTRLCQQQDDVLGVDSKYELRSKLRRVSAPVATIARSTLSTSLNGSTTRIKEEENVDNEEEFIVEQKKETIVSSPTTLPCSDDDDIVVGSGSKQEIRSQLLIDPVETAILSTLTSASLINDGSIQKQTHDEGAAVVASVAESASEYSRKDDVAATKEGNESEIKEEEESVDDETELETAMVEQEETITSTSTTLPCSDDDDIVVGTGSKHEMQSKLRCVNDPVETTTLSTLTSASLIDDGSVQKQTHDEGAAVADFADIASVAESSNEYSKKDDVAATTEVNGSTRIMEEESAEVDVLEPTMVEQEETIMSSPTTLSYSNDDVVGTVSKHEMQSKLRCVNDSVETTTLSTLSSSLIDGGSIQKQHDKGAAVADIASVAVFSNACSRKDDAAATTTEVIGSIKIKEEENADEEEVLEPTILQQEEIIASSPTTLSCSDDDDFVEVGSKHEMRKLRCVNDPVETTTLSTLTSASLIDDGSVQKQTHEEGAAVVASIATSSIECSRKDDVATTEVNESEIKEEEESVDEKEELEPSMVEQEETITASPITLSCSDDDAGLEVVSKHEMRSKLRRVNVLVETTTLSTLTSASLIDDGLIQKQAHDEGAADVADVAVSSSACSRKEEEVATIEVNGSTRIMEDESADDEEVLEPTMIQHEETIAPSPTTLSCSDDDTKEVIVETMTQDVVSQFEGCRLKSIQTVADDEDMIDDEVVMKEDAVVMEEKETDCIQLHEEPAEETKMKDLCSSDICEGQIITTNSSLNTTVLVEPKCSTTSSIGAKDIFHCLSQLTLLGLTLFGIHHRYTHAQATSSQGPIEDIGSPLWHQILHVGLVLALFVKTAFKATEAAACKETRMQKAVCFMRHLMIWTVTIPLFHKCNFGAKNLCVLPTQMASQLGLATSASTCIPNYSLFDVAVANSHHALLSLFKSIIKGKLLNQVYREIQRAVFNPFKFHARVQKALVILKWAKFVGPLIGTCNKFRGNLMDMARKRRQHRVSKAALKRWYFAIDALSKQSKSEQAVVQLQKAFRERQVEKTKKRQLLMANRRWVRSKLEEEERLTRTKLEQIERRDFDRQQRRQVSSEERDGIAQHKKSARDLMKRLLLNPKTSFSVIWKYLTVSCVALEIMTIVFAPALSGDVKKMPLDQFIVKMLLGSRPQCNKSARDAPSLFVPSIGSINDITCSGSKIKQTWSETAHVIATMLVPAVKCICFLDVFITFFTGELSSTGTLEPKPFFQRWVLPGPVLQLIVNPTMASIKIALCNAFGTSMKIGPSLCLHCFLACRIFAAYVYDRLFESLLDIVEKINEFNAQTKGQDDEEDLHWT